MSGKNFLKIPNCVSFSMQNAVVIKDDFSGSTFVPRSQAEIDAIPGTQNKKGLQIRIAATHSGLITRNHGFYLPNKMKKGASSFLDGYPKPVLVHHKDEEDAIGRIIESQYIDTSGAIRDRYNGVVVKDKFGKVKGTLTDQLITDFVNGNMPFGAQVDTIRTLLKDSILDDAEYEGLGHIQLIANITDLDAIQKVLDGRYLTGSTGASTDKAICSVCREDWTKTGRCEHKPGGLYDGIKCFVIAGKLVYDEYSFVNTPADRHSKILQLNYNGVQDNVEVLDHYSGRIQEVSLGFPQYDSVPSKEEGSMKTTDKQATEDKTPETIPAASTSQSTDGNGTVNDSVNTDKSTAGEEPQTQPEGIEGETEVDKNKDSVEKDEENELTLILDTIEDGLSKENEEKLYELLWREVEQTAVDGLIGEDTITDAKYCADKRTKLARSVFCGPNNSFPVTDSIHAIGARKLLDKYEGTWDKTETLKRLDRKSKVLGVSVIPEPKNDRKDNYQHINVLRNLLSVLSEDNWGEEPVLEDGDKKVLGDVIKKIAALVTKDSLMEAMVTEDLAISKDQYEAEIIRVEELEENLVKAKDSLNATRAEYTALYTDLETIQDELVKNKENNRKTKESYLTVLSSLKDHTNEERNFSKFDENKIDSELIRLTDKVDMVKIIDKLGDGMSRNPTEDVGNPIDVKDQTQKSGLSEVEVRNFEEIYVQMKFKDEVTAEQFRLNTIERWKQEGKELPGLKTDNLD